MLQQSWTVLTEVVQAVWTKPELFAMWSFKFVSSHSDVPVLIHYSLKISVIQFATLIHSRVTSSYRAIAHPPPGPSVCHCYPTVSTPFLLSTVTILFGISVPPLTAPPTKSLQTYKHSCWLFCATNFVSTVLCPHSVFKWVDFYFLLIHELSLLYFPYYLEKIHSLSLQ